MDFDDIKFTVYVLLLIVSIFAIVIGCGMSVFILIEHRNVISVEESMLIIQQLAQTDNIEVISHSEIGFWDSWHEVTMTLLIDGELYIARCKNDLTGPTVCMYYEPNAAELIDIWE